MASKQVIDRQKQAKLVLATGETHASALTTRLVSELSPHLQRGEELPDVALLGSSFYAGSDRQRPIWWLPT